MVVVKIPRGSASVVVGGVNGGGGGTVRVGEGFSGRGESSGSRGISVLRNLYERAGELGLVRRIGRGD